MGLQISTRECGDVSILDLLGRSTINGSESELLSKHPRDFIQTPAWLRQMEGVLEELNEGVIIVDDQLRMIFANEALIRLGHYERGELQGHTPDAIFPQEDLPYIMRQHELGQRYGRHRNEFYFPRKGGEKIPAIFSRRLIRGPEGQEYGIVTVSDISAQKHVEEQLRESNALL